MRTVDHRRQRPITFTASAVLLIEDADRHWPDCVASGMAKIALEWG